MTDTTTGSLPLGLVIDQMTPSDLSLALDWAAAEGWNPGLDDAAAFYATDPGGFLMGRVNQEPVSAISVVRHSEEFGFLGFYLCAPAHRGKGFGWATWQAGIALMGARTVGLDGVPDQQANYQRSGFVYAHTTQRWGGAVTAARDPSFRPVTGTDLPDLMAFDRTLSGVSRDGYLGGWFADTVSRQTLIGRSGGQIDAIGTIRACRQGHKIGPLFAPNRAVARSMIASLAHAAGASEIFIDVPDPNTSGVALVQDLGLMSAFSCARMYRGPAPARDLTRIFGETTFELG